MSAKGMGVFLSHPHIEVLTLICGWAVDKVMICSSSLSASLGKGANGIIPCCFHAFTCEWWACHHPSQRPGWTDGPMCLATVSRPQTVMRIGLGKRIPQRNIGASQLSFRTNLSATLSKSLQQRAHFFI